MSEPCDWPQGRSGAAVLVPSVPCAVLAPEVGECEIDLWLRSELSGTVEGLVALMG